MVPRSFLWALISADGAIDAHHLWIEGNTALVVVNCVIVASAALMAIVDWGKP
jgi:hypothetical protein